MVQLLDQTLPSLPSIPRDESYDWASPNVAGLMWTVPVSCPWSPALPCEVRGVRLRRCLQLPLTSIQWPPAPAWVWPTLTGLQTPGWGWGRLTAANVEDNTKTDTLHTDTTTTTPPWGLPATSSRSHTVTRQTPGPASQSDTVWTLMLASRNNWITLEIFRNYWHTLHSPRHQCNVSYLFSSPGPAAVAVLSCPAVQSPTSK